RATRPRPCVGSSSPQGVSATHCVAASTSGGPLLPFAVRALSRSVAGGVVGVLPGPTAASMLPRLGIALRGDRNLARIDRTDAGWRGGLPRTRYGCLAAITKARQSVVQRFVVVAVVASGDHVGGLLRRCGLERPPFARRRRRSSWSASGDRSCG